MECYVACSDSDVKIRMGACDIARSKVLQDIVDCSSSDSLRVPFPRDVINSWKEFNAGESGDIGTATVVPLLHVSDFLCDEVALQATARQLACKLLPHWLMATFAVVAAGKPLSPSRFFRVKQALTSHFRGVRTQDKHSETLHRRRLTTMALLKLPPNIAITVLNASKATLPELLAFLPTEVHPLAIAAWHSPSYFQSAQHLRKVQLDEPTVNALAAALPALPALLELDFRATTPTILTSFPPQLFSRVRCLEIQQAQLLHINNGAMRSLRCFPYLTHLSLTTICETPTLSVSELCCLSSLSNLEHLAVRGIYMSCADDLALAELLSRLPSLAHLTLSTTRWTPQGSRHLSAALPRLTSLRALAVMQMAHRSKEGHTEPILHMEHLVCLAAHLTELCLTCSVVDPGQLAQGLSAFTALKVLHLDSQATEGSAAEVLTVSLASLTTLQTLVLDRSLVCSHVPEVGSLVAGAPTAMNYLHHVSVSTDTSAATIAAVLPALSALSDLDVSSNRFGAAGAALLAPALPSLPHLHRLNISSNSLSDVGLIAILPALSSLPSLVSLDLGVNDITPVGCVALAPILSSITTLTYLNLSVNGVSVEAASALAQALRSLTKLQHLHLVSYGPRRQPCLGVREEDLCNDAGVGELGAAISCLTTLTYLGFTFTVATDAHALRLVQAVRPLSQLVLLHVQHIKISERHKEILADVLRRSLPLLHRLTFT